MFGLKIFVLVQTFRRVPPMLPCNFCHPSRDFDFGREIIVQKKCKYNKQDNRKPTSSGAKTDSGAKTLPLHFQQLFTLMIRSADKYSAHSASRNVRKSFSAKLTEEIARQMVVRLLKRSSSSFSNVPNFTRWVDIHYSGQNASLMFSFRYMILKKIPTNNHC